MSSATNVKISRAPSGAPDLLSTANCQEQYRGRILGIWIQLQCSLFTCRFCYMNPDPFRNSCDAPEEVSWAAAHDEGDGKDHAKYTLRNCALTQPHRPGPSSAGL